MLKTWLEQKDIPVLFSGDPDLLESAAQKRREVVEWLNLEIKKAYVLLRPGRGGEAARYYLLKKFATSIRTNDSKKYAEWWCKRKDVIPEEFYCEYIAGRNARKAQPKR